MEPNEAKAFLIRRLREIADELETGACQAASVVAVRGNDVPYNYYVDGTPSCAALLLGNRYITQSLDEKIQTALKAGSGSEGGAAPTTAS